MPFEKFFIINQCDSSYGFSVIVRVTVTDFIFFSVRVTVKVTHAVIGMIEKVNHALAYPEGGVTGVQPPLNLKKILYCVFAKYTLQALLLCSGKR